MAGQRKSVMDRLGIAATILEGVLQVVGVVQDVSFKYLLVNYPISRPRSSILPSRSRSGVSPLSSRSVARKKQISRSCLRLTTGFESARY
jgi:hypothetical protein